jgi:hypothetical protein
MIWQLDRFVALAMSDTTGIGIERDASSRAKAGSFAPAKTRCVGHGVEVTFSIFPMRGRWQQRDAGMLPKFDLDQIHGCALLIESEVAPRLWSPDPPESASGPGLPHPPNPLSGATRGAPR